MSRLESFIRRLEAQRAYLDYASERIAAREGVILELGLGNGRTYDHLRTRLPLHDIFVFERRVNAHPSCIPPGDRLILGDVEQTLTQARERFSGRVLLVHSDLGTGVAANDNPLAVMITTGLDELLMPGALVCSSLALCQPGWVKISGPATIKAGRYFLYTKPHP